MKVTPLDNFLLSVGKHGGSACSNRVDKEWLRICGVYETRRHWALISRCLERISKQIPRSLRIHSDWWRLEVMDEQSSFDLAAESGAQASIIWCACGLANLQSPLLERWLVQSSQKATQPRALVAMLEHNAEAGWALSILVDRLQFLAKRFQLDLFLCSIPQVPGPLGLEPEVVAEAGGVSKWSEPGCLESLGHLRFLTSRR